MVTGKIASEAPETEEPPVILVVDDEVLIRMMIADYLRECGYKVIEAGSGDEAAAVLEVERRISIVFSDVQMPGTLDGFGLAQWVRKRRPGVEVILTSGGVKAAEAANELCHEGPIVPKPYILDHVVQRIRSLLKR